METLWQCPPGAVATVVLAHGAGAGMRHRSMEQIAAAFARAGLATLRFDFPFISAGRKRPDTRPVATAAVASAARQAAESSALPLFLGGHSFGGRMASHAVLDHAIDPHGLLFLSFPLHPAGKPGIERAAHLAAIGRPMLFLSGTRDALAERALLEGVVGGLPLAELHWLEAVDHGYRAPARARAGRGDVFDEIARVARAFVDRHAAT